MFNFFRTKHSIIESGILHGYVDHHCHLLPGVDDGVQKPETTLQLLDLMQKQGVKEVWFTPHIMEEMPNTPDGLNKVYNNLMQQTNAILSSLNCRLSAEHMLDSAFNLERSFQLPLPGNHILIETSYFTPPYNLNALLNSIKQSGVYPLLAHPCRYKYMSFKQYEELHSQGVHFQLNLPALTGHYGLEVQKRAEWLLDKKFYTLSGTDTHNLNSYRKFLESKISSKIITQLENLIK